MENENKLTPPLPVEYVKTLLLVINALEVLPIMTGGIMHDIKEGESYETLVRRFRVLAAEVDLLALRASQAKIVLLPLKDILSKD